MKITCSHRHEVFKSRTKNMGKQRTCMDCTNAMMVSAASASSHTEKKIHSFSAIMIGAIVVLVAMLFACSRSPDPLSSPEQVAAFERLLGKDGKLPDLPKKKEGQAQIEILSTRLTRSSESLIYPYSGSYRVWTLRLVLKNTGPNILVFGDLCGLFESDSDGSTYEGMIQSRHDFPGYFGVSNMQQNDEDNDFVHRQTGNLVNWKLSQEKPITPSFGGLPPGERFVLLLKFKMLTMIKDKFLSSVKFVSPVLYAPGVEKGPAVLLICNFSRPKETDGDSEWQPTGQSQVSLDFGTLSRLSQDNSALTAMRVVAINRLTAIYGQKGAAALRTRLLLANENRGEPRAAAIIALGKIEDIASIETLCKILSDDEESGGIRGRASTALGNIRSEKALDSLAICTRSENEYLSEKAIAAIGKIGGVRSINILKDLLYDKDFSKSSQAATALKDCGPASVELLAKAITDKRTDVAKASVQALGEMLENKPENKTDEHQEDDNEVEIARRLRNGNPGLSAENCSVALAAMEQALKDHREDVEKAAAIVLSEVPGSDASEVILRAIEKRFGPIPELIDALVTRREPEGPKLILAFLQSSVPQNNCKAAIEATVKLEIKQGIDKLIILARKGNDEVRSAAVDALGKMKADEARGIPEEILNNKSLEESLRKDALTALNNMPRGAGESVILTLAADKKDPLRWDFLECLCKYRSNPAQAAVRSALDETDDESKWRRESLQQVYDRFRELGSTPTIADRLASSFETERQNAANEISKKKDVSQLPALKRAVIAERAASPLWSMGKALSALECRDRDLVSPLLKNLKSKEDEVVLASASILRYITGLHNGPFEGETDTELAEDVKAWQSWWERQRR